MKFTWSSCTFLLFVLFVATFPACAQGGGKNAQSAASPQGPFTDYRYEKPGTMLVTPDLKALSVRALEKRVDWGFADLKQTITDVKQTITDVDARAERRHTALLVALHLEERVTVGGTRRPPRTTNLEQPAPAVNGDGVQNLSSCIPAIS